MGTRMTLAGILEAIGQDTFSTQAMLQKRLLFAYGFVLVRIPLVCGLERGNHQDNRSQFGDPSTKAPFHAGFLLGRFQPAFPGEFRSDRQTNGFPHRCWGKHA